MVFLFQSPPVPPAVVRGRRFFVQMRARLHGRRVFRARLTMGGRGGRTPPAVCVPLAEREPVSDCGPRENAGDPAWDSVRLRAAREHASGWLSGLCAKVTGLSRCYFDSFTAYKFWIINVSCEANGFLDDQL